MQSCAICVCTPSACLSANIHREIEGAQSLGKKWHGMFQCFASHCMQSIIVGGHSHILQRSSLAITYVTARRACISTCPLHQRIALAPTRAHRQRLALASPHINCMYMHTSQAMHHISLTINVPVRICPGSFQLKPAVREGRVAV